MKIDAAVTMEDAMLIVEAESRNGEDGQRLRSAWRDFQRSVGEFEAAKILYLQRYGTPEQKAASEEEIEGVLLRFASVDTEREKARKNMPGTRQSKNVN